MDKIETVGIRESALEIIPMLRRVCNNDEKLLKELIFELYRQVIAPMSLSYKQVVNPTTKHG